MRRRSVENAGAERIHWRVAHRRVFHDILYHPAIAVPVSQLLASPKVRFWHDQVFYKPKRHPGVVAWHQDYSYWTRAVPSRHLTVWIGLDDTTLDNGCIHYVPGSHKWPLLPKLQLLENMDGIKSVLSPEQLEQFKPEPMLLKAGECSIHDSMTLHGSYGNSSDGPRRGVVLNYMHPETRCADGKRPLLLHTPVIPRARSSKATISQSCTTNPHRNSIRIYHEGTKSTKKFLGNDP